MRKNIGWVIVIVVILLLAAWQTWGIQPLTAADTPILSATMTPSPMPEPTPESTDTPEPTNTPEPADTPAAETPEPTTKPAEEMVWIPVNSGTKYHSTASCSGMIDPEYVTISEAASRGFEPCKRCR